MVKDLQQAKEFVAINEQQEKTLQMILPGAYTIILPSRHKTSLQLEAENETLGIRIPQYFFIQALSNAISYPYTATSANIHARGPHYTINALFNTLSEKKKSLLDLVIDFGELPHNLPSTIITMTESKLPILRKGDNKFKLLNRTVTKADSETKALATQLLKKYEKLSSNKPIIFILQGDLGSGKTVFTQGLGEYLHTVHVVSPTFVLYYEYDTSHQFLTKLHHFDLYRAETTEDLEVLGINKLLKPKNLLVFEWGERIGSIHHLLNGIPAVILYIQIETLSETDRSFNVYEL